MCLFPWEPPRLLSSSTPPLRATVSPPPPWEWYCHQTQWQRSAEVDPRGASPFMWGCKLINIPTGDLGCWQIPLAGKGNQQSVIQRRYGKRVTTADYHAKDLHLPSVSSWWS